MGRLKNKIKVVFLFLPAVSERMIPIDIAFRIRIPEQNLNEFLEYFLGIFVKNFLCFIYLRNIFPHIYQADKIWRLNTMANMALNILMAEKKLPETEK